jgi:hypothetical protein
MPEGERAELMRQGAKAAARGDLPATNPLDQSDNRPGLTGEPQDDWSARRDAWQSGHDAQREAQAHEEAVTQDRNKEVDDQ